MTSLRSFDDALAVMREKYPKLHDATLDLGLALALKGYSPRALPLEAGAGDFGEGSALHANTIYLWAGDTDAQQKHVSWGPLAALTDAKLLATTRLPAITTWKTRGAGFRAGEPGAWQLLWSTQLFERRDDGPMSLALAAWRVREGLALAVWDAGEKELLRTLLGLVAFPPGEPVEVWIGP